LKKQQKELMKNQKSPLRHKGEDATDLKQDAHIAKAVHKLARLTSMPGVKYKANELIFLPFECRSLTEDKIVKFVTTDLPNRL